MADTVRATKGDILDSGTWQALADQHGGPKGQPTNVTSAIVPKESDQARGDYDQRPIYRYYFNDGTYVDARTSENYQGWEVSDYKPSDTYTTARRKEEAASTTGTTAGTASDRTAKDIEPDPNNPGHFRWVIRSLNPDGSGKAVLGYEGASDDEARKAGKLPEKPTVVNTNTTEPWIVKSDGTKDPNPNYVPPKPTAPTLVDIPGGGKGQLVNRNGTWVVEPLQGTRPPNLPSGIGQFQPDPSKPGYGLFERRDALIQLVAQGAITEAQMLDILKQDQAMTKTLTDQQTQVINTANTAYDNLTTQRAQDIGLTESRAGTANTQFANAMSFANQNAVGLARSPGVKDIFSPLLRSQQLHQQRGGGMETPAAIPQPKALERFMTIELPGSAKVSIPVSAGGDQTATAAPEQPAPAPAAQPIMDSTQPPARDDYSTNSDTSGGTPQAMSNAHPMMSHFADDPELQSFVASQVGVA